MVLRTALLRGVCALAAISAGVTGVAHAQTPGATQPAVTTLDDIVVTARKREESLQSVPVAVTTQTAEQLERQRITEPTQLGRVVPSLQIRPSSGSSNSAQIALRGQYAGDSLLGVSQPVGLYMDSVNVPHPFGANNSFFDISRVEVLKGPQGTLYGRNTTGGAINIITRGADYNGVHGFGEGEIGNFNSYRIGGAVNVPIVADKLAARLAVQYWNKDGYGESRITGQTFGDDKDDVVARLSLVFDPIETVHGELKVEYGKAKHNGAMISNVAINNPGQTAYFSAALWSNPAVYRPLLLQGLGGNQAALGQVIAAGRAVLDPCIGGDLYKNCSATNQFDDLETWHGALDLSWDITDEVTLRSITGVHHFKNTKIFDLDSVQPQILEVGFGSNGLAVAPGIGTFNLPYDLVPDQESTQWTQELNLSGTFMERLDWMVGAYGSWDDGNGSQNAGALEEFTAVATGSPVLFAHDGLENKSDTWALYTQNDIRFTDRVSITLGARYTEERIEQTLADWDYITATNTFVCHGSLANGAATNYAPPIPGNPDSCATSIFSTGPNNSFARGTFSGTSYLASFNFQITPQHLFYAKTARGFRGGAFGRTTQVPAAPEFATDYELGFKGDWLDRRLRTNVAIYQTNYDNKQVSSLQCTGGVAPPSPAGAGFTTKLLNAATARIQGFEAEFQALPMEGLSVWGNISYTNAKYLRWDNAVSGSGIPLTSAAGLDIAVTPDWQGAIGARYEMPVASGVGAVQLDYIYRGETALTPINNDPSLSDSIERDMLGSVGLINARLEYSLEDQGLTFALWGANLTDEEYGLPGITSAYTGGIAHRMTEAPRTYGVTVRKTFGSE
jgi:iron complex outermembrane receptor protein